MKNFAHVAARLFNKPLLLDPKYAQIMFGAMSERLNIQSLIDINGIELSQTDLKEMAVNYTGTRSEKVYSMAGDIAIIPIQGSLTHNLGRLNPYSGMTGYDGIEAKLNIAMEDADVKGILFDIDSPGGEVSGCFDLSDYIYSLKNTKPIWSISNEFAASAAYAISSATSRIIVPRTAEVGSVGVLTAHVDQSELLKKQGVKVTLIYSGQHKVDGNPYAELPKSVKKKTQAEIDSIRELFVQTVSRNINVSYQHVFDTEAQIYSGSNAVDMKMADVVMSYNETLLEFQDHLSSLGSNIGANTMAKEKATTAQTEQPDGKALTADDLKKAQENGFAEGKTAERERISTIMSSDEAKGRTAQANHMAFNTDMDAESVLGILKTGAVEPETKPASSNNGLDNLMAGEEQPNIETETGSDTVSDADSMMTSFSAATGHKTGE